MCWGCPGRRLPPVQPAACWSGPCAQCLPLYPEPDPGRGVLTLHLEPPLLGLPGWERQAEVRAQCRTSGQWPVLQE